MGLQGFIALKKLKDLRALNTQIFLYSNELFDIDTFDMIDVCGGEMFLLKNKS